MKRLKENILEAILNKSDVRVKEDFYISYKDIKQILNEYFEDFPKIIIESNLQEDFIEGLEHLLNRELTSEEIEQLEASDFIDNVCLNDMFQAESKAIGEYYRANFKDHYKNQVLEMYCSQDK